MHWSIPDPAVSGGTDQDTYPAFERRSAELETRIGVIIAFTVGTALHEQRQPPRCPGLPGSGHRSLQWPEERPQVRGQLGWGLHRGEVHAALELGPVRAGRRGDQLADRLVGAEDREALRHV